MKGLWITLSVVLVMLYGGAAIAQEKPYLNRRLVTEEKKLEDIKRKLRETKKTVKQIKGKEQGLLSELESINRRLTKVRREIRRLTGSITKTSKELGLTERRIKRLRKERKRLKTLLEKRINGLYNMHRGGMVRVLLAGDGRLDVGKRYRYLSAIMEYDRKLMEEVRSNLVELNAERARLVRLRKELSLARQQKGEEKRRLNRLRRQKSVLLASVRREKRGHLKMLKELRASERGLAELIKKLKKENSLGATGFALMKGHLPMPVRGRVVSYYGKVIHPRFKTVTFNNGIVIEAPYGTGVKSVYSGKVVYVGWLRGYGRVIIIDNGGGYYTLFAYLSEVFKGPGDVVKGGDIIGLVGDSGPREGAALYFEIRERGIPRDPLAWIKTVKK